MFEELLMTSKSMLRSVDTYLSFTENRLARAAVTRLYPSRTTAVSGSVTLVHGPAGVGKTHLALWTLAELIDRHPRTHFAYASTISLCEMIQRATEHQTLADLFEQFQTLDVLVCEDFDRLEQAPLFQPHFVALLETLDDSATRVLMTSRKQAGELRPLDQRLLSRCHGGLSVGLPTPGVESRVQLVQLWFRELTLPVVKPFTATARFLAERLPVVPRELRQSVQDLAAVSRRQSIAIDVDYLQRWLAKEDRTPRLSLDTIVRQVAQEFGVNASELRSRSRQQGLSVPRQCAMYLARELTGRPLDQIGQYFDRSHTTVSHSLSRMKQLVPAVSSLRQQVHKLMKQLKELPREDCA